MAAVAVGQGQLFEQPGGTVIDDGDVVAAGAVCEGTGNPTFADAGVGPVMMTLRALLIQSGALRVAIRVRSSPRGVR